MTLILALGNPDFTIQLSDRQLTVVGGGSIAATENKTTLVTCLDARLLVGFTGLARAGQFRTAEWLLEALSDAAPPDDRAQGIVTRFVEIATARFRTPALAKLAPEDRRLSIMFTGYSYWADPPLQISALVSNFQDFQSGEDRAEPWDEFRPIYFTEKRPPEGETVPTYIQRIGAWDALPAEDIAPLREMLHEGRPPDALIGKAVEIMRAAADKPAAGGTVGKDLTSGLLRPDPKSPPVVDYHVIGAAHEIPMLNQAILLGEEGGRILMRDAVFRAEDPSTVPPLRVHKVGRNLPCPCGSGRKYKRCHGTQPHVQHSPPGLWPPAT